MLDMNCDFKVHLTTLKIELDNNLTEMSFLDTDWNIMWSYCGEKLENPGPVTKNHLMGGGLGLNNRTLATLISLMSYSLGYPQ